MYQIVFTKGNKEVIVTEVESLKTAKEMKTEYSKLPEYCNGLVTIEQTIGKRKKILG